MTDVQDYSHIKRMSEREAAYFLDPAFMDFVCSTVANGGSLIDLCEARELRFHEVNSWIYNNQGRTKQYHMAINAREEWYIQSVLNELKKISTIDIRRAFDDNGFLLPIKKIPKDLANAISSIENEELFEGTGKDRAKIGTLKKIKFWDKMKSLELLGKNLKMFLERHEFSGELKYGLFDKYTELSDQELMEKRQEIALRIISEN